MNDDLAPALKHTKAMEDSLGATVCQCITGDDVGRSVCQKDGRWAIDYIAVLFYAGDLGSCLTCNRLHENLIERLNFVKKKLEGESSDKEDDKNED